MSIKALDAEPRIASVLKSMLVGRGPVNANVTPLKPMNWDDPLTTGTHGKWTWIVVRQMIRELPALTLKHHEAQRLCITAFDSGAITPSDDERALGWTLVNNIMVSPPLTTSLDIPCDTHDEWYVFRDIPRLLAVEERFVNYFGFTLANPARIGRIARSYMGPQKL